MGYSYNKNNDDDTIHDDDDDDDGDDGDAKTSPKPAMAMAIGRSIYQDLLELTDFGPLLFQCLVDPVGTIRANAPHLIPSFPWGIGIGVGFGLGFGFGFSGRKKFSPKDDIPDLGGKVILVTGGQYSLLLTPHYSLLSTLFEASHPIDY